jgi:arsenate reductase (thioredoxin)
MSKPRVLFLCTGNSARSQMAEGFLRKYGERQFEAHSAGLEPKGVNPLTIKVMNEVGVDISNHTSKGIDDYFGKPLPYLITVCDDADQNCPTGWTGVGTRMHWSFEDPARFEGTEDERLAKFREVRDLIEQKIKAWVADPS